jgi:hypothetical protein
MMPRQLRIEFAGAGVSSTFALGFGETGVMEQGGRREPIVQDDEDRRTFLRRP